MATNGNHRSAQKKNLQTDDPSILEFSNSFPGTSNKHRQSSSHQASHPGGHQSQKVREPKRPQKNSGRYTPTSSEKRREEHWKVPDERAQILFGLENPQLMFDGNYPGGQFGHPHNHHSGQVYGSPSYRGGKKNSQRGKYNQTRQGGNDSRNNSRKQWESRHKNNNRKVDNAGTNEKASSKMESDKEAEFLQGLMKNESEKMTINVGSKDTNGKRIVAMSSPEECNPQSNEEQLENRKQHSDASKPSSSNPKGQTEAEVQEDSSKPAESDVAGNEKKEKKRRKRIREKKKKMKNDQDKHQSDPTGTPNEKQLEIQDALNSSRSEDSQTSKVREGIVSETQDGAKDAGAMKDKQMKKQENEKPKKPNPLNVYANPLMDEAEPTKEKTSPPAVKDDVRNLEKLGLEQAETRLKKDMIFKLEKKSPTFPEALYFCQLCSHHLNTVAHAHRHIKDKRHRKEFKAKQQDELLKRLKRPPVAAVAALDRHLVSVIAENTMSAEDAVSREDAVGRLNEIINAGLPGCKVVVYGSSVSLVGLKSSDVNVDIQFPETMKTPTVLLALLDLFKKSGQFEKIEEDFDAKVPRIELTDRVTGLRCSLSANNFKALNTTRLLRVYGRIEPIVVKLSLLLRYWGRLCQVDRQSEGSLPPHSFVLMVIFYLQQRHKLPVLHEIMSEHDIESILDNPSDLYEQLELREGEWWYCPTAPPGDQKREKEAEKEIDDDIEEHVDFSESDDDIEISFGESPTKEGVAIPIPPPRENASLDPVKLQKCFEGQSTSRLAELWLGLLKFYSVEFDMENLIITIRSSSRITRSDRGWSHRRIAIEDPCSPKWNLCKPMNSQLLFSYFMMRLKHSVFYFHTAHHSAKSNVEKPRKQQNLEKDMKNSTGKISKILESPGEFASMIVKSALMDVKGRISHTSAHEVESRKSPSAVDVKSPKNSREQSYKLESWINDLAENMVDDIINDMGMCSLKHKAEDKEPRDITITDGRNEVTENVDEHQEVNYDFCYKFTKSSLTDGKAPVTVCCLCKKEGHSKKHCPDEVKVKIEPLPTFTDRLRKMLDIVCREMYMMYVPKEDEVRKREMVCTSLLAYLRMNYDKNVEICLFGSSRNRFTFRGSDLDICMTFAGNKTGEGLDFTKIIEDLAKVLRRHPDLRQIIPITTAKVPIVKFYHPNSALEGDISLYNLLAQRNTSMLALYATIDERCRTLGYAMKAFVKRCCIGDASRGSLSSYAYTLLVIYFLQQRKPPVLPVLQELYVGDESPVNIVDGWNSWFYDQIGNLENVWGDFGKNKESVGELWLGLLRFYTEEFNFRQHVASIRQEKLLTAFEKEWTSKCICIEDPFDLNHNLGAGVSRKMTNFIMKVFVKARERFGTDPGSALNGVNDYQHYFFDARFLMDGQEVPNDRCCRICGKIGHFVKDCPKRRGGRNKNKNNEDARDVECFGCGKQGHYRKDCPENGKQASNQPQHSPTKGGGFFQASPRNMPSPMRPFPSSGQYYAADPVEHSKDQSSPVVIHAKRQTQEPNFNDRRPDKQGMKPPPAQMPEKNEKSNWRNNPRTQPSPPKGNRQNEQSKSNRTPQNNHARSQKHPVPEPRNHMAASSPGQGLDQRNQPHKNGNQLSTPKSVPVNRSLSAEFGKNLIAERNLSNSPKRDTSASHPPPKATPEPSSRNPRLSKHGLTLKDKAQQEVQRSMPTVTEVESHIFNSNSARKGSKVIPPMRSQSTPVMSQFNNQQKISPPQHRPQVGEKINHLIPKQHEDFNMAGNRPHPAYQGYPHSPQYQQFPMSPLNPKSPTPFVGPLSSPTFSTSPRGNQSHFQPPTPPEPPYFRSPQNDPTPPRNAPQRMQNHPPPMRSPNNWNYHGENARPNGQQYGWPSPSGGQNPIVHGTRMGENEGPNRGNNFPNLQNPNMGPPREVYFSPTGPLMPEHCDNFRGPVHHSYPPNAPPTNRPQNGATYWSGKY